MISRSLCPFLGRITAAARTLATLALVSLSFATTVIAVEFPKELTEFEPAEASPIFTGAGPGHWDVKIRERGYIVREGGQYRMWYTGYDGQKPSIKLLGYATSDDGLSWTRWPRNPLVRDHWVEDMQVLRVGDTWYMVAEGLNDLAELLTSRDGVEWKLHGSLDVRRVNGQPIEPGPYGTPTLWRERDKWYLYYERRDAGIWLATSTDLKTWTNTSDEPVIARGPTPYDQYAVAMNQVVKYQGRYYAVYHAADTPEWKRWSTNLAASDDLIHWEKYPGNPLVMNESSGILVDDGQKFRLYTMHDQVRVRYSKHTPAARLNQ
ncbi:MAG: glycosylase [Planctomycetes bacterium]|nr:glycosylase [Planctomycetota bacterium]